MLTILLFQAYFLTRSRYQKDQERDHLNLKSCNHTQVRENCGESLKKSQASGTSLLSSQSSFNWHWWECWVYPSNWITLFHHSRRTSAKNITEPFHNHNNNCILPSAKCLINSNNFTVSSDQMPISQDIDAKHPPNTNTMSLEDKFKAAVKVIHSLPKDGPYQPSNGTKLKFYGLFKQATEGACNIPKPNFWDIVGKYKWDSWNDLGQMSNEEAMIKYIESLKEIVETMSWDGNVNDFLNSIGPFYEFVNSQGSEMSHVKETIDRLTSSSSSSNSGSSSCSNSATCSIVPSPANSCPNSPLKMTDDNSSTSAATTIENEKAEVQVESRTATYETNPPNTNGNGSSYTNGYHNHHPFPPPTPQHTYSRKNSLARSYIQSLDEIGMNEEERNNDETMGITFSTSNRVVTCQEDLEKDPIHLEVGKIETTTATSGTESEKYYSGDSEPDFDDKFGYSFSPPESNDSSTSTSIPGYSKTFLLGQSSYHDHNNSSLVMTRTSAPSTLTSHSSSKSSSTKTVVSVSNQTSNSNFTSSKNRKSSPKLNGGVGVGINGLLPSSELILTSTMERLNRDVDHIVARLRILETAYASTVSNNDTDGGGRRRGRRPFFGGMSYPAIIFLLSWPFAVHFLIRFMSWWWARRKSRILSLAKRSLQ